jgi:dihydropteroate synthase
MPRKPQEWKLRTGSVLLGEHTLIVGVLNVTPDSAADGGRYQDPERACVRALELADQGAQVIEIGAESMRAGSQRVPEAEELRRLVPVLKRLRGRLLLPICVETYKAAFALVQDPELAKVVAQHDAGLVIQHMRGTPETWAKLPGLMDPVGTLLTEIKASLSRAVRQGVQPQRIVLDPGLGMGLRKEQNSEIIRHLDRFFEAGVPLQVSPTGKPFATSPTLEPSFPMSVAAAVAAILRGASILRVHDAGAIGRRTAANWRLKPAYSQARKRLSWQACDGLAGSISNKCGGSKPIVEFS